MANTNRPRRPLPVQAPPSREELANLVDDLKEQLRESRRPPEGKPAVLSKTIWVNGLVVGAGVLTYVLDQADLLTSVGIDPQWFALGGVLLGAINVALRVVTREPLAGMEE